MISAVPSFTNTRLLVVGDVMLDRYWYGPTSRISPEAPVPVVRIERDETRPGGAANVALNVAALGGSVRLLGVVGRDEAARVLRNEMLRGGLETDLLESAQHPTITKLRVLSRNQQLIRLDFEEGLGGAFDRAEFLRRYQSVLSDVQAVILSDYGKGTLVDAPALISAARAAQRPILIDPKGQDYRPYAGATLLTPNHSELEAVVGSCPDDATIVSKGMQLLEDLALEALLVTRSEQGMTLLVPGHPPLHLPAQALEVYDVTGAGDTVIAALGASIAAGQDFAQAARVANLAAGIVVGKLGAASAAPEELARALRRQHEGDSAVLSEEDLIERVEHVRRQGQVVVMTNGCFDILHMGHVRYLEAARRLGDVLVVAVNDDTSVRRLKGAERPLNPLADRMRMLAALKWWTGWCPSPRTRRRA